MSFSHNLAENFMANSDDKCTDAGNTGTEGNQGSVSNTNEFQKVTRELAHNSPSNVSTGKKSKAAEVTTT